MFNSDLDREGATNVRRRVFLTSAAAAIGGLVFWQWRKPHALEAAAATAEPKEVTIVLFSDSGQRLNKVSVARVIKTAAEWRKQLSSGVFDITRNADTEIAFSGKYWNLHDKGIYRCICCDNALFGLGHQIRLRHRLAQFLGAHCCRERPRDPRYNLWHGSHRGFLYRMRCPPRPRLRRRPRAHAPSLLHEFCVAALHEAYLMGCE